MTLEHANTIYCSGIGGIGLSALAQLLNLDGKVVRGSDLKLTDVTQRLESHGVGVDIVRDQSKLDATYDLLLYSSAVPEAHPDRKKAAELGIPQLMYFEALGEYMQGFKHAIAVTGTHGKTTTTAMIATAFEAAGLDPTVVVGSVVKAFDSNARAGGKEYIIVEACEHEEHMLHLHPTTVVVTNIEEEHLDYYRDIDHIQAAFQAFVGSLPPDGLLVVNADNERAASLVFDGRYVRYGMGEEADVQSSNVGFQDSSQSFSVNGELYSLRLPGVFNVSNALACIACCRAHDLPEPMIKEAVRSFSGTWRRFEELGTYRDALVISDYAHHPTAVEETISAAVQSYPDRRIIAVFQPHQRARTVKLFDRFTRAFGKADLVIIEEIFEVEGREGDQYAHASSTELVKALAANGVDASYAQDHEAARSAIDEIIQPDDCLLLMGAGDIYTLAEELASQA